VTGEIELVSDGEGVVVSGERVVIDRFIARAGLSSDVAEVSLKKLSAVLRTGGEVAKTASEISERSALYLKLTPESAKRLKDAGGLMKTKTKGISHAMLGEPGKTSLKWLQVEEGPASLLTNPAVLAGVGGLLSQFAQQAEARELKALLVRMDEKLDDVRRTQRDAVLAKMNRASAAIEEALVLRRSGGDPVTLWGKVSGESSIILEVQEDALLALGALADKLAGKSKTRELKKAVGEIEREVAVQLAILARCLELQDEFRIVELDHVLATAPENLDGHRRGVAESRRERREDIVNRTRQLIERMDDAGAIANAHVLLHARAARSIIASLNGTAAAVDEFHLPLGIDSRREALSRIRWGAAFRDPEQLRRAGSEVGQEAVMVGGAAAVVVLGPAIVKSRSGQDD
jgi:hypothetical protein